ncbi:MAG: tetratricopeptide repeat protein [Phycisphaerales bacterium]|nr:tetratricopeptide repeat protein [Phycisphaerales bacterium]
MSGLDLQQSKGMALAIGLFLFAPMAQAQTTEKKSLDHETELKEAAKRPLAKMVLKTVEGGPLSDAQNAEIEKSNKLMADAEASRKKAGFAAAAEQSQQAFDIRQKILGPTHFLSVTSKVLTETMNQWRQLGPDKQQKLAEADKQLSSAQAIHDGGDFRAAQDAAQKAVSLLESTLPKDHVETGAALLMLGKVQVDINLYDKAEQALTRALRITETAYGQKHPQTALVLDRLGWLWFYQATQGSPDRDKALGAVEALDRAVNILLETFGENRELAESLDNLGTVQAPFGREKAKEAKANKLRALAIRKQLLGPDDKDTGVSYSNLGWIYEQLGEDEKVVPMRKKALAIFEKSLGAKHPYCYMEKGNLARVYQIRNKNEDAVKLYEEMVALDRKQAGEDTPETVGRMARLGAVYLAAGRVDDGIQALSQVAEKTQSLFTAGQQQVAINILQNSAVSCEQHRLFETAIKFREKIVEWDDQLRGANDNLTFALRAVGLGSLYIQAGRLQDAKKNLADNIVRIRKFVNQDQKSLFRLVIPLSNLARVHEKLGELDSAERNCQEVVKICESYLGPKHPVTARAMTRQGRINTLQEQLVMAQFFLEEAQRIFEESKSQDPFIRIEIFQDLARLHSAKKEPDKAVAMLRKALERCDDWPEQIHMINQYAIKAETLKQLLDATGSNDSAAKTDRRAWRSELKTLLEKLEAGRALNAEQKEWLKDLKA